MGSRSHSHCQPQNLKIIILTVTLLTSITIIPCTTASDNDPLIRRLCDKTYAPTICVSCVKAAPAPPLATSATTSAATSTSATAKFATESVVTDTNVINALLDCSYNYVLQLQSSTQQVLADPKTDTKTKEVMEKCLGFIGNVRDQWVDVRENVADRRFLAARSAIDAFITFPLNQCTVSINAAKIEYPPSVFAGLISVDAYTRMADQVMTNL